MELIFVRHGLPARTQARPGSVADPSLTELGRAQAERLVEALTDVPVHAVVSSTASRAIDTARPLATGRGVDVRTMAGLLEYAAPDTPYIPIHEVKQLGGPEWERIRSGELPEFVDTGAFRARVVASVEAVVHDQPGRRTVVVVCHAGVINAYLAHVLGISKGLAFPLDYTSISRVIASRDGLRVVRSVNEVHHVRDLLAVPGTGQVVSREGAPVVSS